MTGKYFGGDKINAKKFRTHIIHEVRLDMNIYGKINLVKT